MIDSDVRGIDAIVVPALSADDRAGARDSRLTMVIDDEEPLLDVVARMLDTIGRRVDGYVDPEAAVAAMRLAPDRYEAVLTDMRLGPTTGIEVAARLTRIRPGIPILLLTGALLGADVWDAAAEAGVVMVLQKPYRLHELVDAVRYLEAVTAPAPPQAGRER